AARRDRARARLPDPAGPRRRRPARLWVATETRRVGRGDGVRNKASPRRSILTAGGFVVSGSEPGSGHCLLRPSPMGFDQRVQFSKLPLNEKEGAASYMNPPRLSHLAIFRLGRSWRILLTLCRMVWK